MDAPVTPVALQDAALRFLRRFGVVAAAWATLLGASAPQGAIQPAVLWSGLGLVWAWALLSMRVARTETWVAGWFGAAVGLELLGPLAGTGGDSMAGGATFMVLVAMAVTGSRRRVLATVLFMSVIALLRPAIDPAWTYAGSISTVLLFGFGGLAVTLLVEAVTAAAVERDRLASALAEAEREAAVARERTEAAARLHDSVLQTLTAIGRADAEEGARLARRASQELRDFLRRATEGGTEDARSIGDTLRRAVTSAADGGDVGVSVVGDATLDRAAEALVDAAAEAVRNALSHGRPPVRVLLEVEPEALTCWVSDRGDGFSLEDLPEDRLGVRRSIVGRVESVGGTATLHGAEWELTVPRTS